MNELKLNKLKMQTPNITNENIEKLAQLFPNIISESKDKNGLKKVVDFDLLKQILSENIVESDDERYRLDWPGKKASLLKANTPIKNTLRPCEEESKDFENTQNLYIEGDNFEVLKLLQESYLNKVKMIYIDPPYNTGKDFVYKDNFKESKEAYEEKISLKDEEENKLFKNTDSNGRFHSDWLSMMYERLLISRDLLKDDGVVFISIDDNEVHNLRKICDEVFGEGNFVAEICWQKKTQPSFLSNEISSVKEYILFYKKNGNPIHTKGGLTDTNKNIELINISNKDSLRILNKENLIVKDKKFTGKLNSGLYGNGNLKIELLKDIDIIKGKPLEDIHLKGKFKWTQETINKSFLEGDTYYIKNVKSLRPTVEKLNKVANIKPLLDLFSKKLNDYIPTNTDATNELKNLFNNISPMDYPKPSKLLLYLIDSVCYEDKEAIILDFFSGSATTAHAVMDLNAQDNGNRKFIMVQLPENTDEKSEAYKAGYKTIPEIGKERIRRAGKKILEDNKDKENIQNLDIGFRVLKTDSSNFKDVYYHPKDLGQKDLFNLESNIKEDRTELDLLFQVMLDLGIELDLKITSETCDNSTIYILENSELVAYFSENISLEVIKKIKSKNAYKVVLKDGCFGNDTEKINAIESLSLSTSVSVI